MERMILAEGGLPRMKEMVGMLKRKGVFAEILPPADGCVTEAPNTGSLRR